jgi:uncharacterized membrane protein SirB2
MFEFYPQIKQIHIFLALTSGAFFAARGAAALMQAEWHRRLAIKLVSYAIDVSLLTAAFMLLTILPWSMFGNGWLLVKVMLIVLYVLLGIYTLRLAKTIRTRVLGYLAALLVFGMIYSIARSHHPLGLARYLTS